MTTVRCCAGCGREVGPYATFCRQCGARLEGLASEALPAPAPSPPLDERRLLRELSWLCGLPVIFSIGYAIELRIFGISAAAELVVDGLFGATALAGAARNWPSVRDALRLPNLRGVAATLVVGLLAAPTILLVFAFIEKLGFPMYSGYFDAFARDAWPVWTAFLSIAVLTPLSEELLFRGLIQPKLEQLLGPTEALVVQAALFSAAHLSVVILLTHFVMGLAFGWVRRYTRSLLPSVVLHAAWNASVLWVAMK